MNAFKRIARGPGGQTLLGPDGSPIREETYSIKFRWEGKQVVRRTACASKAEALRQGKHILAELERGKIPGLLAQIAERRAVTVGSVVQAYLDADCPTGAGLPRPARSLALERKHLSTALKWWSAKAPEAVTTADHDDYWVWRRGTVTRGAGDRSTELELQSLSNAFSWAERRRLAERNPFANRRVYRSAEKISHAREFMPASAGEFHRLAGSLLAGQRSEALGWAYVLQALTGLRHHEVRGLRDEPGLYDERFLYVTRAKHGKNPRVRLDDPTRPFIRPVLEAVLRWKRDRFTTSPWLVPGKSGGQLADTSLAHALEDACARLGIPKRTSHGARAYYASVRWAQGIDPDQIAHELGQRSGDDLVRQVYGGAPPQWDGDLNNKNWVPEGAEPCWAKWLAPGNVINLKAI